MATLLPTPSRRLAATGRGCMARRWRRAWVAPAGWPSDAGWFPPRWRSSRCRCYRDFGLPIAPLAWPAEELLSVMRSDKKNVAGRMRLVLPTRLGEVKLLDDVPEADVREVLRP